tara:strand:- start:1050 stop:2066 length:1017 start_codon:yes stop_codon:yes gene_type:complete
MKKTISFFSFILFLFTGCELNEDNQEINGNPKVFVLCEGNFGSNNAALWSIAPNESISETQILGGSSLGDVAQSMTIHENRLYVVVNNSHKVEVFDLGDEITHSETLTLNNASPRYFAASGTIGYLSCWNLEAILLIDLTTLSVIDSIPVPGMPEDLILNSTSLFASIPSNSDWSPANTVVEINTTTLEIATSYEVINGPEDLELLGGYLYVASTYYGADYSTYTGLSKINLVTGDVIKNENGANSVIKNDLITIDGNLYRLTVTGIAKIKNDLSLDIDQIIGNISGVYSGSSDEDYIYFGITDYVAPDTVFVTNHDGTLVNQFTVGSIPGDFVSIDN